MLGQKCVEILVTNSFFPHDQGAGHSWRVLACNQAILVWVVPKGPYQMIRPHIKKIKEKVPSPA